MTATLEHGFWMGYLRLNDYTEIYTLGHWSVFMFFASAHVHVKEPELQAIFSSLNLILGPIFCTSSHLPSSTSLPTGEDGI